MSSIKETTERNCLKSAKVQSDQLRYNILILGIILGII